MDTIAAEPSTLSNADSILANNLSSGLKEPKTSPKRLGAEIRPFAVIHRLRGIIEASPSLKPTDFRGGPIDRRCLKQFAEQR